MTAAASAPRQVEDVVEAEPRCMVCGHRAADHDDTGRRFCAATQFKALSRGCICKIR